MNHKICQTIKNLRISNDVSQENFAKALGVSAQAVSKWETQKALPDIMLLPKIAEFFKITIDDLFKGVIQEQNILSDNVINLLEINKGGWDGIVSREWGGTHLPEWGVFIPQENVLHLFDDLSDKNVLEIACGDGQSLLYCGKKHARELWGIDISKNQIDKARKRLKENNVDAKLFVSPMEINPGIPEHYFDCVYSVYGIGWTQDLDKTISLAAKYLKSNGTFIFSWDNPLLPCIVNDNGQYVLQYSYVNELKVQKRMRDELVVMTNWKLSSYINSLAGHGFKIECLVEMSDKKEGAVYTEKYYSEHKAQFIHHSFVLKARKL